MPNQLQAPITARMRGRRGVERRASFLRAHPLCVHCRAQGRTRAATDVDHVVPLHRGGPDVVDNLQPLCAPCHAEETRPERGARGVAIGADGNPLRPPAHWRR